MEAKRRYFVGGNWKSNGIVQSVKDLIANVVNETVHDVNKVGKLILLKM